MGRIYILNILAVAAEAAAAAAAAVQLPVNWLHTRSLLVGPTFAFIIWILVRVSLCRHKFGSLVFSFISFFFFIFTPLLRLHDCSHFHFSFYFRKLIFSSYILFLAQRLQYVLSCIMCINRYIYIKIIKNMVKIKIIIFSVEVFYF